MQKTLAFYKEILASMRYSVDDEGLISILSPTGTMVPAEAEGKRLVLPTKARLKEGFGEEFQPFHPLSESMARRGTSPVMQHMQRTVRANLAFTFAHLAGKLLEAAVDVSQHKDLPPSANEFLKKMQGADAKLTPLFNKLIEAAHQKNKLITVYLRNGGTYNGKKVNRLAVIRFPIMELLETEEDKVLGITIKPKQRQVLLNLLRSILPAGDDPEQYSAGSNNRVAPYLHAFLQAYLKVIVQLNKVINRYAKPMSLPIKPYPVFKEETLNEFADIFDEIPSLVGNVGNTDEDEEEEALVQTTEKTTTPKVTMSKPLQVTDPAPLRKQQAAPKIDDDTVDFETMRAALMPQPAQFQPQPQMAPYGQPVPTHVQLPWQQQPQQPMQAQNPFAVVAMSMSGQAQPMQQQYQPMGAMPMQAQPYYGGGMQAQPQVQVFGQAPGVASNSLL